ncbi:MAG TPA: hypothetical protein VFP58_07965 [Candidatus Eisenbacteria bacterium]|nr:hypothetical protein [Candidatus Eisenbacteria bacterium]
MYESRQRRPLTRGQFVGRMLGHFLGALALMVFSLLLGMAGYTHLERLPALDAFLNSAMLLGGMGPLHHPQTPGGKLFAGCYALYAGLVFIVIAGVILAPVVHRVLHKLHWEEGT